MRPKPFAILVLRALSTFLALDLAFRFFDFDRVYRRWVRGKRPGTLDANVGRGQAQRTWQAVERATMLYYRRREDCLPKALTLFSLLNRQGIPVDLCFGVRKFPFEAHSWVESYGEPLDHDPARVRALTVIHRTAG
jgi:hypothetical protein